MPRKKKSETTEAIEAKPKATRKRKSTKKVAASTEPIFEAVPEKTESTFSLKQLIEWTDEECAQKDKEFSFRTADVRDILKSLFDTNERLAEAERKFNLIREVLQKGKVTGYKIVCPHCKRDYMVNSMELHREGNITCKICGTEYKEDENIDGVSLYGDEIPSEVL